MPVISVKKHLTGDIYAPKGTPLKARLAFGRLMRKLAAAARDSRQVWNVNSGIRSKAKQQELYDLYLAGKGPLAAKPGTSNHERGLAADVSAGGNPVGATWRRRRALQKHGLCLPVKGEAWHVEVGNVWRGAGKP